MQIRSRVKIHKDGASVFEIVELLDDGRALIQAVSAAPGRYPFSCEVSSLVLCAEPDGDSGS